MLAFCNNFLYPTNELIYDCELDRCYLLIYKNGTRSLLNLVENNQKRFLHFFGPDSSDFLIQHSISKLTVFVREPIDRFLSGLTTQQKIYKFDIDSVINFWEHQFKTVSMIDLHTVPQFSFLLRATRPANITFEILNLDSMKELYPNIKKINVNDNKIEWSRFSQELQNKIVYFLTEDIVLYNQFQNTTATLDEILNQIRKEQDFVTDYQKYYNLLTYI